MPSISLSRIQLLVLLACAKYRYVTNAQLSLLQIGHLVSIRRATRHLSLHPPKVPLLHCHRFAVSPKYGRLANIFTITKRGLDVVGEAFPNREFVTTPPTSMYALDYHHRTAIISFRILLEIALTKTPYQLVKIDHYFEKTGANHSARSKSGLQSNTRFNFEEGRFFIPDVVFLLFHSAKNLSALFTLECVNGRDTGRTVRQVKEHLKALAERNVTREYGLPPGQGYVSLFLFLEPSQMPKVLKRLQKDPQFLPSQHHFMFATFAEVSGNVLDTWRSVAEPQRFQNFITGKIVLNSH